MERFEIALYKIYYYLRDKKGAIPEKVVYRVLVREEPIDILNKYVSFFIKVGKLCDLRLGVTTTLHESGLSYLTFDIVGYEVNVNQFCRFFYGILKYEPIYKRLIRKESIQYKRRLRTHEDPRLHQMPHTQRIASQFFKIEMYYLNLLVKNLLVNKKRLPLRGILKHKRELINKYIYDNRTKSPILTKEHYERIKRELNKD
jgi:hypothetical protein